jgi:hypothetical protein
MQESASQARTVEGRARYAGGVIFVRSNGNDEVMIEGFSQRLKFESRD